MVVRAPRPSKPDARQRFPATAASVAQARHFALEVLGPRISEEDVLYDAQLIVCELVSNAVKHGPGPDSLVEVALSVDAGVVSLSVVDQGSGFSPSAPYDKSSGGWGLMFVSRLASRWGTWPGPKFTVWAEIDLRAERAKRPSFGRA